MIREVAEQLGFPREAIEDLGAVFDGLAAKPAHHRALYAAMNQLYLERAEGCHETLKKLAETSGYHLQYVEMVFLLLAAIPMRYIYLQRGLSEKLYWDTMEDLRYKLMECYHNNGRWGNFAVFPWFPDFYWCERFKLGRLQYEKRPFSFPEYQGIREGDTVFNCHIPSCGPLTEEAVLESLKKAHAFYLPELKDGILPVVCNSWLLYTPFEGPVFPEGTNLWKFSRMFTKLKEREDPKCSNFWRIFDQPYDPAALKDAPADTGLRRRMKTFIEAGNPMGSAYGILLFDGKEILPKKY